MNTATTKNIVLLLAGAFFLYFSNGRFSFALAAWLYPVFILQISRKENPVYSYLIIPLLVGICCQLSFWKFTHGSPSHVLFYLPFFLGLPMGLLFFIDRLLYSKNTGFGATLIFPLLYTSFDFLLNLFNPFGTLGILGYSQFEFLSFSQLASITGMWGLTFMITWFGSVVYWALENYTNGKRIKKGLVIYFSSLLTILVYGGIRLHIPSSASTVQIAGIHTYDRNKEGNAMQTCLNNNDTTGFKRISNMIVHRLLQTTGETANAGAKIVVWSEVSPEILKTDEDSLLNVFKRIAQQHKLYLVATPFSIAPPGKQSENKTVLVSPDGAILSTHYKYGGSFLEGTVEGDKVIKTISTAYGKLSTIICWDGDFPSIVKQIGKLETDILLVPASDWEEIDPAHAIVTVYRGIENGCSVVRQTRNGLSIMTDPRGRVISQMDHFENNSWITVGQVPTGKWLTLYPILGDLFGWLSLAGSLFFLLKPTIRRRPLVS